LLGFLKRMPLSQSSDSDLTALRNAVSAFQPTNHRPYMVPFKVKENSWVAVSKLSFGDVPMRAALIVVEAIALSTISFARSHKRPEVTEPSGEFGFVGKGIRKQ
jgi:hypothetical protein